jgi:hypothetical protein
MSGLSANPIHLHFRCHSIRISFQFVANGVLRAKRIIRVRTVGGRTGSKESFAWIGCCKAAEGMGTGDAAVGATWCGIQISTLILDIWANIIMHVASSTEDEACCVVRAACVSTSSGWIVTANTILITAGSWLAGFLTLHEPIDRPNLGDSAKILQICRSWRKQSGRIICAYLASGHDRTLLVVGKALDFMAHQTRES